LLSQGSDRRSGDSSAPPRASRSGPGRIWILRLALVVLPALAVQGVVAGSASSRAQARASADELLGGINVPLDRSSAFGPTLAAGTTYRLVATGTVAEAEPGGLGFTSDALRFFICSTAVCIHPSHLIVRYEGDTSEPNLDSLNPAAQLPYDEASHRYEETFTATRSARLEAFLKPWFRSGSSFTGTGFTLELYGPGPTAPSGAPTVPAAPQAGLTLVSAARSWGTPALAGPLDPGDGAVVPSPPIGANQRDVRVTVSGDRSGGTRVVASSLKLKNLVHCIAEGLGAVALAEVEDEADYYDRVWTDPEDPRPEYPGLRRGEDVRIFLEHLFGCLDLVFRAQSWEQAMARPGAAAFTVAGITASSCKSSSTPIQVRVNRAANTLRWRSRRASRKSPARFLRASCRRTTSGAVTLRIRTRSPRVKLRKLVGRRLFVGLQRSPKATGTANLRVTFRR
jgi:hypothetical protein